MALAREFAEAWAAFRAPSFEAMLVFAFFSVEATFSVLAVLDPSLAELLLAVPPAFPPEFQFPLPPEFPFPLPPEFPFPLPPLAAKALSTEKRLLECMSAGVTINATPRARVAADFENLMVMLLYFS